MGTISKVYLSLACVYVMAHLISSSEVRFHQPTELPSKPTDQSEAIVIGHGAEALLARKADTARAIALENVKNHPSEKPDKKPSHIAGYRRVKRRAFFGFGNGDDDFAVFSHSAYDPANEDSPPFYDATLVPEEVIIVLN